MALDVGGSGRSAAQGVYVDDSSQALDRFTLANRLTDLGEWDKAAEVYHETLDTLGRRLIAARTNSDGLVVQYRPVADAVRDALAAWPAEGRAAYRDRFAGEAARALADIRSLPVDDPARRAGLVAVAGRFPLTPAAAEARIEVVDRDLVSGRVGSALRAARAGTDRPSDDASTVAALLLRRVAAAGLLGETEEASEAARRLADEFANVTGLIAGKDQNLASVAADLLDGRLRPVAGREPAADGWLTFAGASSRNAPAALSPGKLSPQFALPATVGAAFPDATRGIEARLSGWRTTAQLAGIFPVLEDGILYWTDNISVHALDLAARRPPVEWTKQHPATENSDAGTLMVAPEAFATPRGVALAPIIDGDRLLVVVGRRDLALDSLGGRANNRGPSLVSVGRRDGTVIWRSYVDEYDRAEVADALGVADDDQPREAGSDLVGGFLDGTFAGPPVRVGRLAWILVQTNPQRQQAFSQSFAAGIDPETGKLVHVVYLTTVGEGRLQQQAGRFEPEPDVVPAGEDGIVYLPTGDGTLAAIEADEGRLLWLNLYERASLAQRTTDARLRRRFEAGGVEVKPSPPFTRSLPFHAATPVVNRGRIYFRPPDGRNILVYDAGTGEQVASLPDTPPSLNAGRPAGRTGFGAANDAIRTVLHVDGDRLYGFGGRTLYCVRIGAATQAVEEGTFDEMSDVDWAYWINPFSQPAHRGGSRSESILGRPAITKSHLLVPLWDGLALVNKEDGRRLDGQLGGLRSWASLPPTDAAATVPGGNPPQSYDDIEIVGNIITAGDRVIVAGQEAIGVFADSEAVRRRLLAAVEANPDSPEPLAALARLDHADDNLSSFRDRLDQAADLVGGRDVAFETALSVVPTSRGLATSAALDAAEAFADEPDEHVRARFAFDAARDAPGGDEARLAAVRDVLENPAWREVPLEAGADRGFTAGDIAASRLRRMRGSIMPTLFDETDRRADQALQEATDVEAMIEVATIYPTSPAATQALFAAADELESSEQLVAAAGVTRRAIATAVAGRDAEAGMEARLRLARLDLLTGTPAALSDAASRLERLAASRPTRQTSILPTLNGTLMTPLLFEQAAAEVRRQALEAERTATPRVGYSKATSMPVNVDAAVVFDGTYNLLPTAAGRTDLVLAADGTGVRAVSLEGGWATDVDMPVLAATWVDGDAIVFGPQGVVRLSGDDGSTVWRFEAPAEASAVAGNDVVRINGDTLTAVAPDSQIRWTSQTSSVRGATLCASRDVVVVQGMTPEPETWAVTVHDAATGRLLMRKTGSTSTDADSDTGAAGLAGVLPLSGGRVAMVFDDRIVLLDPAAQTLLAGGVEQVVEGAGRGTVYAVAAPAPEASATRQWLGLEPSIRIAEAGGYLVVATDVRSIGRRDATIINLATAEPLTIDDPASGRQVPVLLRGASTTDQYDPNMLPPDARERAQRALQVEEAGDSAASTSSSAAGTLVVEGRRVYVLGDRGVEAYDLDAPGGDVGPHWSRPDDVYARRSIPQ